MKPYQPAIASAVAIKAATIAMTFVGVSTGSAYESNPMLSSPVALIVLPAVVLAFMTWAAWFIDKNGYRRGSLALSCIFLALFVPDMLWDAFVLSAIFTG